jgi:predicted MPP superfamily phosphohydrolase
MTGRERRWINPNKGFLKLLERNADMIVSRFLYPHLSAIWNPYSWLLEKRFALAETSLSPQGWPEKLPPLKVLLISDIHCGIFLKPETLSKIISSLIELKPHLVCIAGDIVTGAASDLNQFLDALAPLAHAPLRAWYCYGNHDYFGGDPEDIRKNLKSIGIETLKNDSVLLTHGNGSFVLGGIDDRILGAPDWGQMLSRHGTPHLLLAHNPDFFYEAEVRRIPLTLSGHTHGGQIRLPQRAPILRQSRYCLDEGSFAFRSSLLVVSRGLGSVGLPWRWGADPEAVLIEIVPPQPTKVK